MASEEKTVTYQAKNIYMTLNTLTPKTKNVWLVFHGIGYLSKYFARYFDVLDPDENYIIVPQAPSKYYLGNEYKYVGASWLTKEHTKLEINNVMNYVDAVFESEKIPEHLNLILFGFSQGVSIAVRWLARTKVSCKALILYAGGIPNELEQSDFDFLDWNHTSIKLVYGDQDTYLTEDRLKTELPKLEKLFEGKAEVIVFNGGHEMRREILSDIV